MGLKEFRNPGSHTDRIIIRGAVGIVSTVHYVRVNADRGPAILCAGLWQVT